MPRADQMSASSWAATSVSKDIPSAYEAARRAVARDVSGRGHAPCHQCHRSTANHGLRTETASPWIWRCYYTLSLTNKSSVLCVTGEYLLMPHIELISGSGKFLATFLRATPLLLLDGLRFSMQLRSRARCSWPFPDKVKCLKEQSWVQWLPVTVLHFEKDESWVISHVLVINWSSSQYLSLQRNSCRITRMLENRGKYVFIIFNL